LDLDLALNFVERRGTALELARMKNVLHGEKPPPSVAMAYLTRQNPDGSFPFGQEAGGVGAVGDTCFALAILDDLGLLGWEVAGRALGFLVAAQLPDGGWDEAPAIARYDPPPWAVPGDERARVYLIAYAALWLGLAGRKDEPAFDRALRFLLARRDAAGRFAGFIHATWLAAGACLLAGEADAACKSIEVLAARPLADWADSQMSWALWALGAAGLPADHGLARAWLPELARRQRADGSWTAEDGEAYAVNATIETAKVMKLFGAA